ncbi:hypothetical protein [Legionella gresilensis]|uniref:hypothetical protein n=1 Tax=Legionella gresilensis TaxID=91823 RepID=UPI0010414BAF|nr:hypothetical protein [Legionella gresilensis]
MKIDLNTVKTIISSIDSTYKNDPNIAFYINYYEELMIKMVALFNEHEQNPSSFLFKKLKLVAQQIEKIYTCNVENITKDNFYNDTFRFQNSKFRGAMLIFVEHIIFEAHQLIFACEDNLTTSKDVREKQNEGDIKKLTDLIKLKLKVSLIDENSESLAKIDQKINEEVYRVAQVLFGEEESSVTVKKLRSLETVFTELGQENAYHLDELNKAKKEIKELRQKLESTSTTFMTELSRLETQRSLDNQNNTSLLNQLQLLILENNNLTRNVRSDMQQMQNEIVALKAPNAAFPSQGNNSSRLIPHEHDKKHSGISHFFRKF